MNQYDYGFKREDFGPGLITAGLSMLANNDGRMSVPQLIGQGGLDALEGHMARKKYEAAMARQQAEDERTQAQHDMQMKKGQMEMSEAERLNALKARFASGDRSPEVMYGLYGKEMTAHDLAVKRIYAEQAAKEASAKRERERQMALWGRLGLTPGSSDVPASGGAGGSLGASGFKLTPEQMVLLAQMGPEGKAVLTALTQASRANAGVMQEDAKAANKYIEKLIEQRENANASLQQFDALDALLGQGMKTGKLEEYKNDFAGFLEAMGASPELITTFGLNDPAMVAAFNSLQMTNIMNVLARQKGVQTEGDAERASKTWANIGNTEEGNRWVNQYHRNIAERSKERAYFLENELRRNGGRIGDAEKAWEKHAKTLGSVVPPMPKRATPKKIDYSAMSDDEILRELNRLGGDSF